MKVLVIDDCSACSGRGRIPYPEAVAKNILGTRLTDDGPVICAACSGKGGRQVAMPLSEFVATMAAEGLTAQRGSEEQK